MTLAPPGSAGTGAVTVTVPGVYGQMPDDVYHGDPVPEGSLSASGAKLLLPPGCPALYAYRREHPKVSAEFDYGTAAHKLLLGTGPDIAVFDGDDWRTRAAGEFRRKAREAGQVPVLYPEHERLAAMVKALGEHEIAGFLFDPARGTAEQSLFWVDEEYGIWRRARLDWQLPGMRLVIADFKTCQAADLASVRKAIANYGYHQQDAWYTDGAVALGLDDDPAFVFVFQEKTPPYLISVVELDEDAVAAGRERNRLAMEIYRDCRQAGVWPGYTYEIATVGLPRWAARLPIEGDELR
jgi:PDDEXK-like domain of unknown function (DUF3799)